MKTCGKCKHGSPDRDGKGNPTPFTICELAGVLSDRVATYRALPPCVLVAPMLVTSNKDASACRSWRLRK